MDDLQSGSKQQKGLAMLKHVYARRRLALALTASLSLTACATVNFECPIPKDYSAEVQAAAADELSRLPENSVIGDFVADYGVLRAEARACRGSSHG